MMNAATRTSRHMTPEQQQYYANAMAQHGASMQGMSAPTPAGAYGGAGMQHQQQQLLQQQQHQHQEAQQQQGMMRGQVPPPGATAQARIATAARMMAAAAIARAGHVPQPGAGAEQNPSQQQMTAASNHMQAAHAAAYARAQNQQQQQHAAGVVVHQQHAAGVAAANNQKQQHQRQSVEEISRAFQGVGKQDLLPFLAPRLNQATSATRGGANNMDQSMLQAAREQATAQQLMAVAQQQQQQQRQAQQAAEGRHQGGHHQGGPMLPAPASAQFDQGAQFAADELESGVRKEGLLVIPPIGAQLPSMRGMTVIDIPTPYIHPHDVLCGRGGGTNNHAGNEAFRDLVTAQKVLYLHSSKRDKPYVSRGIVRAVRNQHPPGRFIQKNESNGLWYDIGDNKAREKTSQALREGAPEIRREITTTLGVPVNPALEHSLPYPYGGTGPPMSFGQMANAAAPRPAHHMMQNPQRQLDNNAGAPLAAHHAAPPQHVGAPLPAQGMGMYGMHSMAQQSHSMAQYEQMRVAKAMAIGNLQGVGAPKHQILRKPVLGGVPATPGAICGIARHAMNQNQAVVPRAIGLGRGSANSVGLGGRVHPFSGTAQDSSLGAGGRNTLTTPLPGLSIVPRPPSKGQTSYVKKMGAKQGSRGMNGHAGAKKNETDGPAVPPLPHNCSRRLVLAEVVAQKTVNGTITDDMKAEEYRISLYMDAGLLNIDPKEIVRSLAKGETESDVVEKAYGKLCEKRKRHDLLPPCRKAPKTAGALAALGALTRKGINEALAAIGAVPPAAAKASSVAAL